MPPRPINTVFRQMKMTSRPILFLIFFLSGVSGLGYEILWARMLSASLGHEIVSVLAVVSAFFSGLAVGAWFLDRTISQSSVPGKWLIRFELVIGLWALLLVFVLPDLNRIVSSWIGVSPSPLHHWFISFLYPFTILLPATMAMGATLPAMDRLFEKSSGDRRSVAGLYSINTFGAVAGTLLVTFLLLPMLGIHRSAMVLAGVNFACAMAVFAFVRKKGRDVILEDPMRNGPVRLARFYPVLFMTGLAGIGFEVLIVRVLSQMLENTVFSFATMLIVFLFGTATGAGIYHKVGKPTNGKKTLSFLLLSTAFLSLIAIFLLQYTAPLFHALQAWFGSGFAAAITAESCISLLFFFLPTVAMGATFSHLAQSIRRHDGGVGKALCLNTLGGALAPILFGIFLLPRFGIIYTLILIPAAYFLCFPRPRLTYAVSGVALFAMGLSVVQNFDAHPFLSTAEGDTVISHHEGIMATVSVIEDGRNARHLKVNNHFQMGGTTSVFSDQRQAYLPLLLHAKPRRALFLGLGSGITFAAAGRFPDLKADGVELIPEVITAMAQFEKVTGDLGNDENLNIINADARRYVTATDRKYDVVIADLFHPSRDGAGSLYTREHFNAIGNLLTEEGIFCQWLPLYQLDLETFKIIVKTFLQVFPRGQAYLAHYSIDQPIIGLVGAKHPLRFPEKWYRKRVRGQHFRKHLAGFGYDSIYSLLGTYLAGGDRLAAYAGDSVVNTDAFPAVMFRAPRFVYGKPRPPHQRLLALLDAFSPPDPESILCEEITEEDHMARSRLANYWIARDAFIALGTRVPRTQDASRLYETASGPLLNVVRKSIDFSAAYFPLVSIAYDIYPHDRDASYRLLRDLERANPLRPEAGILRQRLFVN